MRVRSFAVLAILSLAIVFPQAQTNPSAEKQILALLERQMQAANAHDTDRFLSPFLHSDNLVFVSEGTIIRGWNRLREQQLVWWNNGKSDVVYTQTATPELDQLAPGSMLVTQQLAAQRNSSAGNTQPLHLVATTVWKKSSAGWQIVYCHESLAP